MLCLAKVLCLEYIFFSISEYCWSKQSNQLTNIGTLFSLFHAAHSRAPLIFVHKKAQKGKVSLRSVAPRNKQTANTVRDCPDPFSPLSQTFSTLPWVFDETFLPDYQSRDDKELCILWKCEASCTIQKSNYKVKLLPLSVSISSGTPYMDK